MAVELLSPTEWEHLYPKRELHNLSHINRSPFELHYLIVHDEEAAALRAIQEREVAQLLQTDNKKYKKLTPLLIACMKGNVAIATALLNRLESQNIRLREPLCAADKYGKNCFHLAALTSSELYALLCQKINYKNPRGFVTPQVFVALAGQSSLSIERMKRIFWETTEQPLSDMPSQELETRTGLKRWSDQPRVDPNCLAHLWKQHKAMGSTWGINFNSAWHGEFNKKPPKLVVGASANSEHAFELRTAENLREGRFISEFAGTVDIRKPQPRSMAEVFSQENFSHTRHRFEEFDFSVEGNETRFINCGWPTACAVRLQVNGYDRCFVLAIKEGGLKPNKPIRMVAGLLATEVAFNNMLLLGKKSMLSYFEKGLAAANEKYLTAHHYYHNNNPLLPTQYVAFLRTAQYLLYPLTVPKALLYLHASGVVPAQDWLALLSDSKQKITEHFVNKYPFEQKIVRSLIMDISKLVCSENSKWVLTHIEDMSLGKLLKGLQMFKDYPHLSNEQIEAVLADYDPFTDPQGCFGHDHIVANISSSVSSAFIA